jgi:hypothetical protein
MTGGLLHTPLDKTWPTTLAMSTIRAAAPAAESLHPRDTQEHEFMSDDTHPNGDLPISAEEFFSTGASGVPSVKFAKIGDSVTGRIIREPNVQQQRDYETGEVLTWPDGNPKIQLRVFLTTDQRDGADPDDTGERALYVKGAMQTAISRALLTAGAKKLDVGGILTVKYTGNGQPRQRGMHPPKVYSAQYVPPAKPEPTVEEVVESTAVATAPSAAPDVDQALPF